MAAQGLKRACEFSWKLHVEQILELSRMLTGSETGSLQSSR